LRWRLPWGRQQRRGQLAVEQRRNRRLEPGRDLHQGQHRRAVRRVRDAGRQDLGQRLGFGPKAGEDPLGLPRRIDEKRLALLAGAQRLGGGSGSGAGAVDLARRLGHRGAGFDHRHGRHRGAQQRFALSFTL